MGRPVSPPGGFTLEWGSTEANDGDFALEGTLIG